jgi:hypothetical protein
MDLYIYVIKQKMASPSATAQALREELFTIKSQISSPSAWEGALREGFLNKKG